jgi:hypothetical protein
MTKTLHLAKTLHLDRFFLVLRGLGRPLPKQGAVTPIRSATILPFPIDNRSRRPGLVGHWRVNPDAQRLERVWVSAQPADGEPEDLAFDRSEADSREIARLLRVTA